MGSQITIRRLDTVIRVALDAAMLLPAIMVPFLLGDPYSLPKAVLLRLMLIFIAAAWLGKVLISARLKVARIGVHPSIILFGLILISTTVLSAAPAVSLFGNYLRYEGLVVWSAYLVVFVAAATHTAGDDVERRLKAGVVIALPIAVYALAQFLGWDFMPPSPEADMTRSSSTLGNAVYLGTYLVLIIPVALSVALNDRSRARYLYGAVLVLSVLALILTYTRAAWFGTAVGLVFFAAYAGWGNRKNRLLVAGLFGLIIIAAAVLLMIKPEKSYLYPRLASSVNLSAGSVGDRLNLWRTALGLVRERPLLGWGLETFRDVSRPYRPDNLHGRASNTDRPHNQLLYLASSAGLAGAAAYIWLVALIFNRIRRGAKENKDPGNRVLAAGILAAGVGYFVQEQFSFSQIETAPLFWLLMGFGVVLGRSEPSLQQYDLSRRPAALGVAGAALFTGLAVLAAVNFRFLAADYRYAGYPAAEAAANLSSAVRLNPYENTYRHALAAHLYDIGRLGGERALVAGAALEFEKALSVNPQDKVVAVNLAATYAILAETDGRYLGKTIEAYERVLRIDPRYTAAHRSLAVLFLKSDQSAAALVHLRKWLSVEPDNGEAFFYTAAALDDQRRKGEAIKYYRKAARANTPFAEQAAARLRPFDSP